MNSNDLVISTEGLSKSFDKVHALKSLNLRVPQKSIFAFLGPNGAGKTTTIKLLLGLLKPTSGGGKILGMDILRDSVDIRARIGYLPQDARFYEHMTARQTLEYTARFFYAGPQSEIDKRVDEMIELVGLEGKADRPIKGFSGGERQRLGIAQAEVNYPDLLILDDVQKVSDQVAIVNQGELVTQAPIDELLAGTGDAIYSVTLKGDTQSAYTQVTQQSWVSGIEVSQNGGGTIWQVSVTDETAAEDQLMSLLVSSGLKVSNFSRKEQNLEEVFLNIVERSQK